MPWKELPVFLENTRQIFGWMRGLSFVEAGELWKCNGADGFSDVECFDRLEYTFREELSDESEYVFAKR